MFARRTAARGWGGPGRPAIPIGVVAVLLLAAAAPAAAQEERWLELVSTPRVIPIDRSDPRSEAVLRLQVRNLTDHAVRVETVAFTFLASGRSVGGEEAGGAFFRDGAAGRARILAPRGRVEWTGICVPWPPAGADALRLELVASMRRGVSRLKTAQSIEVAIGPTRAPVELRLPFDGLWYVSQGHGCRSNHRLGGFGGDFAWDFVRLPAGRGSGRENGSGGSEGSVKEGIFASFGQPVLAPVDGRVVRMVDDVPDNGPGKSPPRHGLLDDLKRPEWVFGNFVILEVTERAYVLLAHLQESSIAVAPGQTIRAGTPIARCGSSGNSSRPHLHLQVMDRADPADPEISGVPARFVRFTEIEVQDVAGRRDMLARRVDLGDPPEGSIVTPSPVETDRR